jgi:hypothetical protein
MTGVVFKVLVRVEALVLLQGFNADFDFLWTIWGIPSRQEKLSSAAQMKSR